jgi:hypothetical protein
MTIEQREAILSKVKKMLQVEGLEAILDEHSEVLLTPVTHTPIGHKKSAEILLVINNDEAIKYDEEEIAKILAK